MIDPLILSANGAAIPALGLGTWKLSGEACASAVAAALGIGYRHLDTAAMYGNEEAVGQGIAASGVDRETIFVTTKVWSDQIGAGDLQRSAEASLEKLALAQVDLLLIHWPNPAIPLRESIAALCDAKHRGLTRHIGVANFPVALLDEAVALADEPLVANQCEYHPHLDQQKLLAACRGHGIAFTSYCPLGRGEMVNDETIGAIASAHGRTPAQIVLRWHVQQTGVAAIPKSGNTTRMAENAAIFDFSLSESEMAKIHGLARRDGRLVVPGSAPVWDEAV